MTTKTKETPKPVMYERNVEADVARAINNRMMRHVSLACKGPEIEAIAEAQSKVRAAQDELANLLDSTCERILKQY